MTASSGFHSQNSPPDELMNDQPPLSPDEHEELVHTDDTVIGRALRWSLVVAVAIAVIAGVTFFILKRKPAPPPPKLTQLSAPVAPDRSKQKYRWQNSPT